MSLEKNIERIADALEKLAGSTAIAEAIAALNLTVDIGSIVTGAEAPAAKPSTRRQPAKPATTTTPEPEPEPPVEPDQVEEPAAEEVADDMGLDDEPPADEPKPEEFKEDDVRKALKNYRDINGSDATMKVLKEQGGGATGMGTLKPENYAAVMKIVR